MPRPRAPWWMYIVAASYIGFAALYVYQLFHEPIGSGAIEGDFRGGGMSVLSVQPGSAEAGAGLEPGDRILAIDGRPTRNVRDWEIIRANTEVGRPERWVISRGGEKLELTVKFPRIQLSELLSAYSVSGLAYVVFMLTSIILGLIVVLRRPYDPVARIGGWVLATAAITFGFPDGWAATWRHLPGLLGLLLWIPEISRFVSDAIFLSFFFIFPKSMFRARWPWLLIWTPALALLPWRIMGVYQVIYEPGHTVDVPAWVFSAISLRNIVYVVGGLAALVLNYRWLNDVNQRRRVRVLLTGVAVSTLGVVAWIVLGSGRSLTFWFLSLQSPLYVLWLAFPLSFAYAILRHRVFDVGVLIRQGLQYALARGALLSLVPVLALVMLGDLLVHGDRPLLEILQSRGWVYGALGAVALLAHVRRQQWLVALDRRFFREHYDARQLLSEVVEEAREAHVFERFAPRAVARIEAALHPEFVALFVRDPHEANFRSLAAVPAGQAPLPPPAESKLLALVRVLGKPLETPHAESGWLQQQLPQEETEFLRKARIDMLVPISTALNGTEALLALGIKKSEEPYTQEDQGLLVAIASSLALLLEKPAAPPARPIEAFEECPKCGACYDVGAVRCVQDNADLLPTRLPRLLAGRYRLESRRGRGGMGAVYEAVDTALERRVAVKVLRDELTGNAEAAERFQREARAAASFAHPNVVTIYDFGVASATRAFLVMELLEGTALRDELKHLKRMPAPRTLSIMRDVCAAVEAAHRRQLVHRDLKPENIFLTRSERGEAAKVLDFGIAKFLPTATQVTAETGTGALIGTLLYMSPEQLRGGAVEISWDLWALGVVAYEMLAGEHPFRGGTAAEFHGAILSGQVTPLSAHVPEAPQSWREFFARALALESSRRPGSAARFFSELEQALS